MVNKPIQEQVESLIEIVSKNKYINQILENSEKLFGNKIGWYLAAGCISQSVWNYLSGKEINEGIKDYDLIYYDEGDITYEAEDDYIERGKQLFKTLPIEVEIRNQARVHLWFEKHFGYKINPIKSCEESINSWPTTATTVGINRINSKINVFAPNGLNDLFGMVVRPHKPSVIKSSELYDKKVEKWLKHWPNLTIIPWE